MSKWIDIAERCEKATGPDREIDCDMARLLGWERQHAYGYGRFWVTPEKMIRVVPLWSDSLDALTALIDRELPVCRAMDAMKRDAGKAVERKNAFENGCGNG